MRIDVEGLVEPQPDQLRSRLKKLREHRWSSYRAYGNYAKTPQWLNTSEILRRAGGRAAYRKYVQEYVTRGLDPSEFVRLTERVAVGHREFLDRARKLVRGVSPEQPDRFFVRRRVPFERAVSVVEDVKREPWSAFRERYGDWGQSMILYLARQRSGLSLREIGERAGGMDYKNVSTRVRRFNGRLAHDRKLKRIAADRMARMTNDET